MAASQTRTLRSWPTKPPPETTRAPSGLKSRLIDPAAVLAEGQGLAPGQVPGLDQPVHAARGEAAAVGVERQGHHEGPVPAEGRLRAAGLGVPEDDAAVLAPGGQAAAVGAVGQAADEAGVAVEGPHLAAGVRVPEPDGPVPARRGELLAVGAEGHGEDDAGVPREDDGRGDQPARLGRPDPHPTRSPAAAIRWPSGLNATPQTGPGWSGSGRVAISSQRRRSDTSQTLTWPAPALVIPVHGRSRRPRNGRRG